jgi:energy-coupling factor transport system permease protein
MFVGCQFSPYAMTDLSSIFLLASGIRKADRVAVAMDSRAFTGERERSYYRVLRIDRADCLLGVWTCLAVGALLFVSWQLGLLRFWRGDLGF